MGHGVRAFRRAPGFTAAVVVSLALGVGANGVLVAMAYPLLVRPLPYPDAHRLVAVALDNGQRNGQQFWAVPVFQQLRELQNSFGGMAAYGEMAVAIGIREGIERNNAEIVTANYFRVLQQEAAIGRVFDPGTEADAGAAPVAVLGHSFWQQRYGADQGVLGSAVHVDGRPFTVIGVMPPGVRGQTGKTDVWLPLMTAGTLQGEGVLSTPAVWWMRVIGRLNDGITLNQAQAEATAVGSMLIQHAGPDARWPSRFMSGERALRLVPLRDTKVDPAVAGVAGLLLAASVFLLLSTCANIAGLSLVRATTRIREFAIRRALGADGRNIAWGLLSESFLIAVLGGVGALLLARWGVEWLVATRPWATVGVGYARTFDYFDVEMSGLLIFASFAAAFAVAGVFSLVPGWLVARTPVSAGLRWDAAGRSGFLQSDRRLWVRGTIMVSQVAVALVLLVGASLLIRSVASVADVALGFEPARVTTLDIWNRERRPVAFYRELEGRLRELRGVERAALSLSFPMGGLNLSDVRIRGTGSADEGSLTAGFNVVTPGYFRTHGIGTVAGTTFSEQDRVGAPRVAVVNTAMAAQAWPGEPAVGKTLKTVFRIAYGDPEEWFRVIGVVHDARYRTVEGPPDPVVYLPAWQPLGSVDEVGQGPNSISVRSGLDTASLVAAVRREVHALDPAAPLHGIATMEDRVAQATAGYRYSMFILVVLSVVAVVVAAVGIHGVVSYTVSARTHEIGVRMALGASPARVVGLVTQSGLRLVALGAAIGIVIAGGSVRFMETMLYGVSPVDPVAFVLAVVVLSGVAILSGVSAARRAGRIDPMVAMRSE